MEPSCHLGKIERRVSHGGVLRFFLGCFAVYRAVLCDIDTGVCGVFQFLGKRKGFDPMVVSEVLNRPAEKRAPVLNNIVAIVHTQRTELENVCASRTTTSIKS